jgi:predicted cupin superfamily sugar epimerase
VEQLIADYQLSPHPEGGCSETYRAATTIAGTGRNLSTAILPAPGLRSLLHRTAPTRCGTYLGTRCS